MSCQTPLPIFVRKKNKSLPSGLIGIKYLLVINLFLWRNAGPITLTFCLIYLFIYLFAKLCVSINALI